MTDIESGRPVAVLPDRTAETLTAWLNDHPGIEIVCRDRASSYAEAVRTAVPDAIQVADRFHLWKNLAESVEKCVAIHRSCLKSSDQEPAGEDPVGRTERPRDGKYLTNTHERHATVHELADKGVGTHTIAKLLHLDPKTVRRYAQAVSPEELIVRPRSDHSPLRPYQAYLNHRWNEGCTDSGRLHAEIRALGYRGSDRTVRRWLEPLRALPGPVLKISDAPSVRRVTGWLTRHPDSLNSDEKLQLKLILARRPELAAGAEQVRDFARMMTNLDGERLPVWIEAAKATDLPVRRADWVGIGIEDASSCQMWNVLPEGNAARARRVRRLAASRPAASSASRARTISAGSQR